MILKYCRKKKQDDEESQYLDYSDKKWAIKHHASYIINLVGSERPDPGQNNTDLSDQKWSYRVNFAELQRLRLRQLQHTLVDHAVTIATTRTHPENWPKDMREYVQALQDYDYMGQRRQPRADPFLVTGERYVDRCILEAAMSLEPNAKESLKLVGPLGFWETKDTQPEPVGGTRTDNYRRGWVKGFYTRVAAAAMGGIFLIAPMWLMVLQNTMYTGLVATTLFVGVFGFLMAYFLDDLKDVMSTTAAYAAVLVVFVGLTTSGS
ncbi:hypothetical protein V494_04842 [Pseudogymnoascus sp. VKM F-4513 (FW-928)]|nr:hypothetical protein V494_04842 [Pseudogymnoascus sp. VKM F-4513 (FW-928)]